MGRLAGCGKEKSQQTKDGVKYLALSTGESAWPATEDLFRFFSIFWRQVYCFLKPSGVSHNRWRSPRWKAVRWPACNLFHRRKTSYARFTNSEKDDNSAEAEMAERLGDGQRGHKYMPGKNKHMHPPHTCLTALQTSHVEGRCGCLGTD